MGMTAFAQDEVETTISGDIVSSYIWRGQDLGSAAIQPTLGVGYKGFSLSAWGSYGIADPADTKEFDLTLAYSAGGFNIGITDYWFNAGQDPEARYFKYDAHGTNHVFEATVGYDFGLASLQWYTNIGGNDGFNKDGCPIQTCHSRLDCYGRCRPVRHRLLRHDGLRRHQCRSEGDKGDQGDRLVLHPHLRTGGRQPLFTKGLPGSRHYAAALILSRHASLPSALTAVGRDFFIPLSVLDYIP